MTALKEEAAERGDGRTRPNYPIESVDNVLRLLLLIEERGQIRVSEASSELGTAVSTAHRLLAMLQHHKFVQQDPVTKVYAPGPVFVRLGLSAVRDMDIRAIARPFLVKLRDEVGETVHLALPQDDQVLFVDSVETPKALRVSSRIGTSMWAHCTSVGKAYLACQSDERVLELYPSIELPAITRHSITSRSRLFAELEEVRKRGFAENADESEDGVGSVGVAILDREKRPVACISVSAPTSRLTPEARAEILAATTRAAASIELLLP
ncbi:MAG TPA: IclR family transcriptional regulator [Acidimicrobiales bacterium]|nr:IclR family transcriptional regulator [Acidimicrobiales bacterium]